jgi:hypothetical protein
MTQDEIIRMAREAGFYKDQPMYYDEEMIERFAALVAEATKEKAAKVCAMMEWRGRSDEAIWKGDAADECAAAIRSMK